MPPNIELKTALELDKELGGAFATLKQFVDLSRVDLMQPMAKSTVYTAYVTLWMLVYQRMHGGTTLDVAVKNFFQQNTAYQPDNKRLREKTLSNSTAAYSGARKRLEPVVTEWFFDQVASSIIATTKPSLGEQRVFIIDGTTVSLAPTPALKAKFPPASNASGESAWPILSLVVAHEMETGCALMPETGAMYGEQAASETFLCKALIERLPPNSIVMADAGFGIFSVAHEAIRNRHDIVSRLTVARFNSMVKTAELVDQQGDNKTWKLQWRPSRADQKAIPRLPPDTMHEVLLHEMHVAGGGILYIVTTLTHSRKVIAELYHRRVDIETDIRSIKISLDIERMRGKSEAIVRTELLTSLVAYNLVVQFRRQAAKVAGVSPRRLSFTRVRNTFNAFLLGNLYTTPQAWREAYQAALVIASKDLLPNRPEHRNFPRKALTRRKKSTDESDGKKRKATQTPAPPLG
ncbi:MAG: IS4 family transposase [Microcoleus sp.]